MGSWAKKVDTNALYSELASLEDLYYQACHRVRECHNCEEGWVLETWADGREHQNRCCYCWAQLCEANRAWRKVRDALRNAGEEPPSLDNFHKRLSEHVSEQLVQGGHDVIT